MNPTNRCAHCGINLAKVDPKNVVVDEKQRVFCSSMCRTWAERREHAASPIPERG
jgi:hypothetical protein